MPAACRRWCGYLRAGRAVSRDLFPSHGAGDRPDAGRSVRRQQAIICFPAIRWSNSTNIGASPNGRCWSTWLVGPTAATQQSASWALRWRQLLGRQMRWKMACERTVFFDPRAAERGSIFSRSEFFEQALRESLPPTCATCRCASIWRGTSTARARAGPAAGQNFLFDPARDEIRPLADSELFRQIPFSYRICRVYSETHQHDATLAAALDALVGGGAVDDVTNM